MNHKKLIADVFAAFARQEFNLKFSYLLQKKNEKGGVVHHQKIREARKRQRKARKVNLVA